MTRIQLFYSRAYPGNTLRANTLQALAHLGVNPEMQVEETVPEQIGTPLPALAKTEYRSGRRIFPAARAAWDAAA